MLHFWRQWKWRLPLSQWHIFPLRRNWGRWHSARKENLWHIAKKPASSITRSSWSFKSFGVALCGESEAGGQCAMHSENISPLICVRRERNLTKILVRQVVLVTVRMRLVTLSFRQYVLVAYSCCAHSTISTALFKLGRVVTLCNTRFVIKKFYVLPTREYLCVLYGSQKKQLLFPNTALSEGFYKGDGVCLLRGANQIYKYNSGKS